MAMPARYVLLIFTLVFSAATAITVTGTVRLVPRFLWGALVGLLWLVAVKMLN